VINSIDEMAPKSKLIIIMPSPTQYDKSPVLDYARSQFFHNSKFFNLQNVSAKNDIKAIEANEILLNVAKKYKNVIFLSRQSIFNQRESSNSGIPYSAEGIHLSIFGSKDIAKEFINDNSYVNLISNINK